MTYARIQNDTVVEILQPIPGFSLEQCFHPSIIAMCELVGGAELGWVRQSDGSFADPQAVVTTDATITPDVAPAVTSDVAPDVAPDVGAVA